MSSSTNKPWVLIVRNGFLKIEKGPFTEGVCEELIGGYDTEDEAIQALEEYVGGFRD